MSSETDQSRIPDRSIIWKRLVLQEQEEIITLTDEQRRAFTIRGITQDLLMAMGYLLYDPEADQDPEFRRRLVEKCEEDAADLGREGVTKAAALADPDSLQGTMDIARHAAGLLIEEDFQTIPSRSTVLSELSKIPGTLIVNDSKVYFYALPQRRTPVINRWQSLQQRMARAWNLLGLPH